MIDAQAALAMGLPIRVVPPEQLMPAARELAARIAANSGPAQTIRLFLAPQ